MNKQNWRVLILVFLLIVVAVLLGKGYLSHQEEADKKIKQTSRENQELLDNLFIDKKRHYFKEEVTAESLDELADKITEEKNKLADFKQDVTTQEKVNKLFNQPGLVGDKFNGDVFLKEKTTEEDIQQARALWEKSSAKKTEWGKTIDTLLTIGHKQWEAIQSVEQQLSQSFHSDGSLIGTLSSDEVSQLLLDMTKVNNQKRQKEWLSFLEESIQQEVTKQLARASENFDQVIESEEYQQDLRVSEDLKQSQKQIQAAKKKYEQEKKRTSDSSSREDSDSDQDDKEKEDKDSDSSVKDEDD